MAPPGTHPKVMFPGIVKSWPSNGHRVGATSLTAGGASPGTHCMTPINGRSKPKLSLMCSIVPRGDGGREGPAKP